MKTYAERLEDNKKPKPRAAGERTIDPLLMVALAQAPMLVARAKARGWIKGGAR